MEPTQLTIEDLLMDESFIAYCKNNSGYERIKWEKFAADHVQNAELVAAAKQSFAAIFQNLAAADLREQEALIESKLRQADSLANQKKGGFLKRKILAFKITKWVVAATFTGLLFLFFLKKREVTENQQTFMAGSGEKRTIQLPDGTSVTLNAVSKINLLPGYNKKSREILLEGEAFFDVKHNEHLPFIVHTNLLEVKALGTAFNVKAYPNDKKTETVLLRGLLEVTLLQDHNRKLTLHPNEKIYWDDKQTLTSKNIAPTSLQPNKQPQSLVKIVKPEFFGQAPETAWMNNLLVFDNETFEEIAKKMERWYNVKIVFQSESIKEIHFTGIFEKEQLPFVLNVLKETNPFNYEIKEGAIKTIEINK